VPVDPVWAGWMLLQRLGPERHIGTNRKPYGRYPPMPKGGSFALDAVKAKIEEAMRQHEGQWLKCQPGGRFARGGRLLY